MYAHQTPHTFCGVARRVLLPGRSPGAFRFRGEVFDLSWSPGPFFEGPAHPQPPSGGSQVKFGPAAPPGAAQDIIGLWASSRETSRKGVDSSRQPDGGHGSRNPLRSGLFDWRNSPRKSPRLYTLLIRIKFLENESISIVLKSYQGSL